MRVRAQGLSKRFGDRQALEDAGLELEPGCLRGLIGPDGAGKTTLVRLLMGLLRPDKGEVSFSDAGAPLDPKAARQRLAYMPQSQSLYADLSVSEHLDFFADLYRLDTGEYRERRAELLHITRLGSFQDRPAGQLSGGMYKKLGLMCALLQRPEVLLLDEPTNGVDPISRREFWSLLYQLSQQGVSILLSTAYMDEAERCAQVTLLSQGRVLAEGEPRQVMEAAGVGRFEELFVREEAGSK